MQTKDLINTHGVTEPFIFELIKKLTVRTNSNDSNDPNSIMVYENLCNCDEGWLCEHRLQFIIDFLKGKVISGITIQLPDDEKFKEQLKDILDDDGAEDIGEWVSKIITNHVQLHRPIFKCIYCNKTAKQSGLMQMTINAPGTYLQCYDFRKEGKERYCKENVNLTRPDGSKEF